MLTPRDSRPTSAVSAIITIYCWGHGRTHYIDLFVMGTKLHNRNKDLLPMVSSAEKENRKKVAYLFACAQYQSSTSIKFKLLS